jgi:TRAP-type C4-dicarboxylate transport system permease small subunit
LKFVDKHLEEVAVVLLLAIMSALVAVQIFMRYVMGASLAWSEELARYCFIWMTYLGISYAVRENAHIRVTIATDRLPYMLQPWVRILSHVVFGIFAGLVVYEGFFLVQKLFRFGQSSASLGLPMAYVYIAPVVGFGCVLFRLLQGIWREIGLITGRRMDTGDAT